MNGVTRRAWGELYRRGFSLLPADPQTKRALVPWKEYQTERASVDTVKSWVREWPDCNPGVITGQLSGVIVLDCDGTEGKQSILNAGVVPETPTAATGRGQHFFFAYPDISAGQRVITKAGVLTGLDSRGDGGFVVGVGSVHSTGAIYHWEEGRSPEDVPFAQAPKWWLDYVVSDAPDPLLTAAPLHVPVPIRKDDDRARKYVLTALEGEVRKVVDCPDGQKHDQLLRSACALAGFIPLLTEQEIESGLFDAIANRAQDRRAARLTIRDGIDYGMRRPRDIPEPTYQLSAPAPVIAPPVVPQQEQAEEGEPTEPTPEEEKHLWTPIPIGDLRVSTERIPWIWDGYLAPQMQTSLSGVHKGGKTTLLGHLLASLGGDEEEFVGRRVAATKVLYVSEERERLWVTRREDFRIGNHVHLVLQPFMGTPSDADWGSFLDYISQQVAINQYGLVVFDSVPNLWPVQRENENSEVGRALGPMKKIADAGAALLMVFHPSTVDKGVGRNTRGASRALSMVDIIVEFRRMSDDDLSDTRRVLSALGRFDDIPPEVVLSYMAGYGYDVQGTKAEAYRHQRKTTLWDILPVRPPGSTAEEIIEDWPDDYKPTKRQLTHELDYMARDGVDVIKVGNRYWHAEGNAQWQRAG